MQLPYLAAVLGVHERSPAVRRVRLDRIGSGGAGVKRRLRWRRVRVHGMVNLTRRPPYWLAVRLLLLIRKYL